MRAKDRDAWIHERQRLTAKGKAEVARVTREWFLSACAEWESERTADNLKAVAEAWKTWRR
jgi:hypothetical protein